MEKIKKEVIDFLFPLECFGCKKEGIWICHECFSSIPFKSGQSCVFCRKPNLNGSTCNKCAANHYLDQCLSAGNYTNPLLSQIIKACKYSFAKELSIPIAQFIINFLENDFSSYSSLFEEKNIFLVPIPLHKKRLNWRGFNQSELLAHKISKKFEVELLLELLRIKNNTPQAKLEEEKRRSNLSGSFYWTGRALNNKKIILIDDVATTGTTLDETAKILKQAGAQKVIAITVAGG